MAFSDTDLDLLSDLRLEALLPLEFGRDSSSVTYDPVLVLYDSSDVVLDFVVGTASDMPLRFELPAMFSSNTPVDDKKLLDDLNVPCEKEFDALYVRISS